MDNKLVTLAEALVCRANLMARRCEGSEESELFRQLAIHLSASLLATREACKERDSLNQQVVNLAVENELLKESVEHAAGCIRAAEAEGLIDALGEKDGERLADLIHRRLCHAYLEVATTATDAAIANIQAQGVDMAINHLTNKFEGTGQIGVPVMALEWLAAELRKEAGNAN